MRFGLRSTTFRSTRRSSSSINSTKFNLYSARPISTSSGNPTSTSNPSTNPTSHSIFNRSSFSISTRFYSSTAFNDMPSKAINPPSNPFPVDGLLPKESTQSLSFKRKYPTYDGRQVRIAILDTGCDPAAAGLSSNGKMVDVIDCTGSGDVMLSEIPKDGISTQSSDAIRIKAPFTGRNILLSNQLKNPSGTWKYGYVKAFDLWPRDLIARRKRERLEGWKVEHERLMSAAQEELIKLGVSSKEIEAVKAEEGATTSSSEDSTTTPDSTSASTSTTSTPKDQRVSELKARISVLKDLMSSYSDLGPIIELIAFNDGQHWRVVVGGAEGKIRDPSLGLSPSQLSPLSSEEATLDLTKVRAITDFKVAGEHDVFGEMDLLTYSVNVLSSNQADSDPDRVSLVCVAGSHGTHVAGISAAKHDSKDVNHNSSTSLSDESSAEAQNGVAPGASIISLKIGDSRLGSMEQGQALLRAAQALITTKSDIANLSYGEDGAFGVENKGAFAESLRDHVIRKRDILFISSAGNNGPALTTVGQPGGSTSGVLSVGAYVTAGSMQKAEYALVEDCKDSPTTWCSRGPCADGEKGVGIYAPGAAITSIPKYCLQTSQLMNGTSMSSPNACGAIALLLSAMKQEKIPITAARVIKAVQATGKDVSDDLGVGFLQVDAAWDYLLANKDRPDADAEFRVAVTPAGKPLGHAQTDKRGIYLRELLETQRVNQYNVTVKPTFHQGETERAYGLQLQCSLTTTAPWVKAPEYLLLGANGRTFEVRVDSTGLEAGKLHTAFIEVYDSQTPGFKLFDIPVTVAKPAVSPSKGTLRYSNLTFSNGKVDRNFLHVPEGAQWAEARIRSSNHAASGTAAKLWIHLVQVEPHQRLHSVEKAYVLNLIEGEPVSKKFSVKGGMTMEICLAQFWAQNSAFDLDIEFEFHGIQASRIVTGRDDLTIIGGEGYARIECVSLLRPEEFKPTVSFETRRTYIRPTESSISPLNTPRDIQPSGRQLFELVSTYSFKLAEASNSIQYALPLSNNLYDSAVPMLCQLFDVRKNRVDFGDVYPKDLDLPKGEYTLKVSMLHDSMAVLDKLKNSTLRLDQKLSKAKDVKLDLYEDHVDLFGAAKPSTFKGPIKLYPGERKVLVMDTNLEGDAVPKEAQPGDILIGSFSFASEGKNQLRYVVPPSIKKEKEPSSTPANQKETTLELMTALIKKISDDGEKKKFVENLLKENPKDLGVLVAKLETLKVEKAEDQDEILKTAKQILDLCDEQDVLHFIGTKKLPVAEQTNEFKIKNQSIEKQKSAIILALNRKSRTLLIRNEGEGSAEFEETFSQYRKYFAESSTDKDFVNVYVQWSMIHSQYGTALQAVRKLLKDLGNGTSENLEEHKKARELELDLLGRLNWKVWESYAGREKILGEPKDFAPF